MPALPLKMSEASPHPDPELPAAERVSSSVSAPHENTARQSQPIRETFYTRHEWWLYPLGVWLLTRVLIWTVAQFGRLAVTIWPQAPEQILANPFHDWMAFWDAGWYQGLAQGSYFFSTTEFSSVAFFPLYPLLGKLFIQMGFPGDVALKVVSNFACVIGLVVVYALFRRLLGGDRETARRGVLYLAVSPIAIYFVAGYTESLFVLLCAASMLLAEKKRWLWAALFAALASATRLTGIIMWGVLGLLWLRDHGWFLLRVHRRENWINLWAGLKADGRSFAAIQLAPAGLLGYMLFQWLEFGTPTAFLQSQAAWSHLQASPLDVWWRTFEDVLKGRWWQGGDHNMLMRPWESLAFLIGTGLGLWIWRRWGAAYGLFCLLSIFIPAVSQPTSMVRYAGAIFLLYLPLAMLGRSTLFDRGWLIVSASLMGLFTVMFATAHWVA